MKISKTIENLTHNQNLHIGTLLVFIVGNILGYKYLGGLDFVQSWGGSVAAVIATAFLVTKSQGYWFWMMVNSGLWFSLFLHQKLPMLAWLQASLLLMSAYGMLRWARVARKKIGYLDTSLDRWGILIASVVFIASIIAYWNMPGYRLTFWWWLEFGSVLTAISAIAMDSYRYKLNWVAWTLSNVCSAPLFLHNRLWGPFVTLFIYQAINVLGWFVWVKEELAIKAEGSKRNA